jgi:hypothetical protein
VDNSLEIATIQSQVTSNGKTYPVTSVASNAFSWCTALRSVSIPPSVIKIGSSAFAGCSNLSIIIIPNSVTEIGSQAFNTCTSLTKADIGDAVVTIGDYAFSNCSKLITLTIGSAVKAINKYAFRGCSSLNSVTLPATVTTIGECAFYGCTCLKCITCSPATPPSAVNSDDTPQFSTNVYSGATLYVPKGKVSTYKAANCWSQFTYISEIGTAGVDNIYADPVVKTHRVYRTNGTVVNLKASDEDISQLPAGMYIIDESKVLKQ